MLVYRVAHKSIVDADGINVGPYAFSYDCSKEFQPGDLIDLREMEDDHSNDMNRPVPSNDGIELFTWHHCGFGSLAELKSWFAGWLRVLNRIGFLIFVFEVDKSDVVEGDSQLAFDIDAARVVKSFSLLRWS